MGDNPGSSVLNKYCRSHEVKNLFVADAASFVSNPDKNPTLTINALAWRTAEYLAEEMRERQCLAISCPSRRCRGATLCGRIASRRHCVGLAGAQSTGPDAHEVHEQAAAEKTLQGEYTRSAISTSMNFGRWKNFPSW